MNSPIEVRKVIGGVVLTILYVCLFLFIKPTLVIDWAGDGSNLTPLLPLLAFIGLLVIFFYNLFYKASAESTKLSWTASLTIVWLSLIIFYPFKAPTTDTGQSGAIAFFTLIGGLAVVVLWVRFFSDEIVA